MSAAYPSLYALRDEHNALLKRQRAAVADPQLWTRVEQLLQRGVQTGALLDRDDERQAAQDLLDYWVTALLRAGRNAADSTLAAFNPELAPEIADAQCPYVGLDAFRKQHAHFFFGRQRQLELLLSQLAASRLLMVIGPSGSGKSSLVLAGLLPALAADALPGSVGWRVLPVLMPGTCPINALAELARSLEPASLRAEQEQALLRRDERRLAQKLQASGREPALLIVDQFEELFTLCENDDERQAFLGNLLSLVDQKDPPCRVVLTLRSDFEPHLAALPALSQRLKQAIVRIHPMEADELRECIERPAELVGLHFEEGLLDELVRQVRGEPAGLPLLQFTLHKLWQGRVRNRVTWAAFRSLGGVREALARSADALYEQLIPEDRLTMRRILLELVQAGAGLEVTSRRLPRAQLYHGGEAADRISRVLERLLAAGLLRQTRHDTAEEAQIEVAHEALVRNWQRLVDWLVEERARLRLRLRLTAAAEHWAESARDDGLLLRGAKLAEAMALDDLRPLEVEFVRASKEAAEADYRRTLRRQRSALRVVLAFALLVAGFGSWAVHGMLNAERWQQQAEQTLFEHYQEQGRQLLSEGRTARAFAYLDEAASRGPSSATLRFLLGSASMSLPTRRLGERLPALKAALHELGLSRASGRVLRAMLDRDGRRLRTLAPDGLLQTWDLESGAPLTEETPLQARGVKVSEAIFSSDGQVMVVQTEDGGWLLWEREGEQFLELPPATAAALSQDGRRLALAHRSGAGYPITLWDVKSKQRKALLGNADRVHLLAFSPDGLRLLSTGEDKIARLWDSVHGGKPIELKGHDKPIIAAAFDPSGMVVLTGSEDGTARRWAVLDGHLFTIYKGLGKKVTAVDFRPDNGAVLTGSDEDTVRVFHLDGTPMLTLEGDGESLAQAFFSTDGSTVLTVDEQGQLRQQAVATPTTHLWLLQHDNQVRFISSDAAGRRILSAGLCNTAYLVEADTGRRLRKWSFDPQPAIQGAALSPDGESAVFSFGDRALIYQVSREQQEPVTLTGDIGTASFSPDGTTLVTGGSAHGSVQLWEPRRGELVRLVGRSPGLVRAVAFSPDGKQIFTAGSEGSTRLWSLEGTAPPRIQCDPAETLVSALFSPRGDKLLTGTAGGSVQLWDTKSGRQLVAVNGQSGTAIAFDLSGEMFVTGGPSGIISIWDRHGRVLSQFLGSNQEITALAVGRQDGQLVFGDEGGSVQRARPFALSLPADRTALRGCVPFKLVDGALVSSASACDWTGSQSASWSLALLQGLNLEASGNHAMRERHLPAAQQLYELAARAYTAARQPRLLHSLQLNQAILAALRQDREALVEAQTLAYIDQSPSVAGSPINDRSDSVALYRANPLALLASQAHELIDSQAGLTLYERYLQNHPRPASLIQMEYAEASLAAGELSRCIESVKQLLRHNLEPGDRLVVRALGWAALHLAHQSVEAKQWSRELLAEYQAYQKQRPGLAVDYAFGGTHRSLWLRPSTTREVIQVLELLGRPLSTETEQMLAGTLERAETQAAHS